MSGLEPHDIAEHLWSGYVANRTAAAGVALDDGAVPHAAAVATMWRAAQPGQKQFASGIDALPQALPGGPAPSPAPGFVLKVRRTRIAGLGSRDHPRLVLDGEIDGARAVFERKPLAPAAAGFLAGADPVPDPGPYAALLRRQDAASPAAHHRLSADTEAFAATFGAAALEHAARRMVSAVAADHAGFQDHVSADDHLRE